MEIIKSNYKERSIVKKITITSLMLSMIFIFHSLAKFMKLPFGFIDINISLVFILPVFYFSGPWFGILTFIIRMFFGLTLESFTLISIINQSIILFYELFAVLFLYIFSYVLQRWKNNHSLKIISIFSLTIICTTIIATILNAVIIFPLYVSAYTGFQISPSLSEAIKIYPNYRIFFLGISNYWVALISVYLLGNLIKFSLIFLIYLPLAKIFSRYKTIF